MRKGLGMSSEEVGEIGKWKNLAAFTSHYVRPNASKTLGSKISQLVHKVSPLRSAEADLTWTTRKHDFGGNVREAEAQNNGEPTVPPFDSGNPQPEWFQELCQHDTPHTPGVLPLNWEDDGAMAAPTSHDQATSSNACLGSPPAYFPDHAPPVPDVVVAAATVSNGQRTPKLKRKASPRGSPPRKFAFAAQKHKDMQF